MTLEVFEKIGSKISRNSPEPIYKQLRGNIQRCIEIGHLRNGQQIPGDIQLSEIFKVNHQTVRKALNELVEQKLIQRKQKSGTFVSNSAILEHKNIGFYYFAENESNMLKRAEIMQQFFSPLKFDLKLIGYRRRDFFEYADILKDVNSRNLTAAIIVPLSDYYCLKACQQLEEIKFPYIKFGNPYWTDYLNCSSITGNLENSLFNSLKYLQSLGHKSIGMVCNTGGNYFKDTFINFYKSNNMIPPLNRLHFIMKNQELSNYSVSQIEQFESYLSVNSDITALIISGLETIELLSIISRKRNIRCPDNLSVVLIGNFQNLNMLFYPKLTNFQLSDEQMAKATVENLISLINTEKNERYKNKGECIKINFNLVEGDSVKNINNNSSVSYQKNFLEVSVNEK